jgi:tetratricopeptide (TPR) repeat protein
VPALVNLGALLLKQEGGQQEAEELLMLALGLSPGNADALVNLGALDFARGGGGFGRAEDHFREALIERFTIRLAPSTLTHLSTLGPVRLAVQPWGRDDQPRGEWSDWGSIHVPSGGGRPETVDPRPWGKIIAEEDGSLAIRLEAPLVGLGAYLARVEVKGREAEVRLVRDETVYARALNNLGYLAMKKGAEQEAVELLQEATAVDPAYATPRFYLGTSFRTLGDNQTARRWLKEFLRLEPEGSRAAVAQRMLTEMEEGQ